MSFKAIAGFFLSPFSNPVHVVLLFLCLYLVYNFIKKRNEKVPHRGYFLMDVDMPDLNCNLTMRQLRNFDGYQPDARILVAVNGYIFDVSSSDLVFGPGGPWARLAGRDMTRFLARPDDFDYLDSQLEFDDLSDLTYKEMRAVKDWERKYRIQYPFVGKVLRDDVQKSHSQCSWAKTYVDDAEEDFGYNDQLWRFLGQ